MSEDKLEEKYLGNAKLSQKPERKLVLRLGKDVVNTPNIKNGAVTAEKLNENVATDYIQPMLDDLKKDIEKQIVSIETGGLALSDLLGNSEFVGINQKTLTRYINDLQSQIELLESNVVIIQSWGGLVSLTKGTHRYDPETDTLYAVREVTTYSEPDENGIATPDTHLEWVVSPMDSKTLYLRRDTLEWYEYAGGKLIPIGTHRIDISELDTFINKSDLNNSSTGVYAVVDKEIGYDNVDGKIGTLSLFESLDEETITQIFTTQYIPVDGVFVSTSESSNIPKTYFRTGTDWECPDGISITNVQWTPWQEVSAHIDVDDALDPTYTSENPVKNGVISAKFDEVDAFLKTLQGADSDVEYFEDYDESDNVTFMNSTYVGRPSNGKIVYMTNYNLFAFKTGSSYYTEWNDAYGKVPSTEYNMTDEDTEELTIRKDKNFLLLTEDGGLPFTIDSKLNSESANPVQNKIIYEALASLKPFVFTYYNDSVFEGNIIANLEYSPKYSSLESAFDAISEAFAKGINVVFNPSISNLHVKTVFTLTQFDKKDAEDNAVTNPCVGTVVGSDGFYSILINKSPGYQGNDPLESITFRRDVAFDRSLSMGDKSMLLMNSTSVSPQNWVANIDGSFLVYNYIDNKLYKLNQKNPSYIVESNRVTPSKNIIYVDPAVNKCYRWNNDSTSTVSTMVSIGGGNQGNDPNTISALQEKVDALMALLDVSSTGDGNNKVYSSKKLNSLTNIIGDNTEDNTYTDEFDEEQLTLTARLIDLENSLGKPAIGSQQATGLIGTVNSQGDLLSEISENYLSTSTAESIYAAKEALDGKADKGHRVIIVSFWDSTDMLVPTDEEVRKVESMEYGIYWMNPSIPKIYKGSVVTNNGIRDIDWAEEDLSAECLYINAPNKEAYIYNNNDSTLVNISMIFDPDDIPDSGSNETPEPSTPIEEDGNIIINPELIKFNSKTGNLGAFSFKGNPEDITSSSVLNAINKVVSPLYPDNKIGPEYSGQPHIWTASELKLQDGGENYELGSPERLAIGTNNYAKILTAANSNNCIGIKLDKMYCIMGDARTKYGTATEYYQTTIRIFKDFVIDGEVGGKAVGGFIIDTEAGNFFTFYYSLNLRKVKTVVHRIPEKIYNGTAYAIREFTAPYYIDTSNGINQVVVDGCKFEDQSQSTVIGRCFIHTAFANVNPFDSDGNIITTNCIEHLIIKNCSCTGATLLNGGYRQRVTKSLCIVDNIVTDIINYGIKWNTVSGSYAELLGYMTCPMYVVGNTFEGINDVNRIREGASGDYYYTAILAETAKIYVIDNNISNFVSGVAKVSSTGEYEDRLLPTYDAYLSCNQVYFANNRVTNIARFYTNQSTVGILKAKSYLYSETVATILTGSKNWTISTKMDPIRYWKSNTYINNIGTPDGNGDYEKGTLMCIWNNRTYPADTDAISYDIERDFDDSLENPTDGENNPIVGYSIADLLCIKLDTPSEVHTLKDFVFSKNTIEAENSGIYGMLNTQQWNTTNCTIEGNIFKAAKISSSSWNPTYHSNLTPEQFVNSSFGATLFSIQFNNVWKTDKSKASLRIAGNKFYYTGEDTTIRFFLSRIQGGNKAVADVRPKPTNSVIEDNVFIDANGDTITNPESTLGYAILSVNTLTATDINPQLSAGRLYNYISYPTLNTSF